MLKSDYQISFFQLAIIISFNSQTIKIRIGKFNSSSRIINLCLISPPILKNAQKNIVFIQNP